VAHNRVERVQILGANCVVAGTGYTGEDGVEIAVPLTSATMVFEALINAGISPAGLGARDTLRLEAGFPLYGHELGAGISPIEAGLSWVVAWNKSDFRGRDALKLLVESGPRKVLIGIVTDGRRPPREGCHVSIDGRVIGMTTSGNFSPILNHGIALAFVEPKSVQIGSSVVVNVRGSDLPGRVVKTPFIAKRNY
jgi:aminomethyltransferase